MYDGRSTAQPSSMRSRPGASAVVSARSRPHAGDDRSGAPADNGDARAPAMNGWSSGKSTPTPGQLDERPPSRLVYDGRHRPRAVGGGRTAAGGTGEQEFLMTIQNELEGQRDAWRSEIDRLSRSTVQLDSSDTADLPSLEYYPRGSSAGGGGGGGGRALDADSAAGGGANSYVDTSGSIPLFKAFVDVSEFSPTDVHVTVDKMTDKIVVQARQASSAAAGVSRSFTQRIQLPRFADDAKLAARMNQNGILKLEVPLLYYFPPEERDVERDGRAKSFVYEVRDDPADPSRQLMEILVNTGRDVAADQLRVEVDDGDRLLISAEEPPPPGTTGGGAAVSVSGAARRRRRVIKRYTLPPHADVAAITSRLGVDGRLTILIPIKRQR